MVITCFVDLTSTENVEARFSFNTLLYFKKEINDYSDLSSSDIQKQCPFVDLQLKDS